MAQVTGGNNVSSSAQINPGVVETTDILDETIAKVDVGTGAVGTDEILDGEIVNADISTSAGIVDTKLAQITTASKVSGAALTLLTSIPAGAGKIPAANLSGVKIDISLAQAEGGRSSVAESTLKTVSIPANTLGTANGICCEGYVNIVDGGAGGSTYTIRVKYGATTLATHSYAVASGNQVNGKFRIFLFGNGTTSAQKSDSAYHTTPASAGYGNIAIGTSAEDSTTALNLTITAQNSQNNANSWIRIENLVTTMIGA